MELKSIWSLLLSAALFLTGQSARAEIINYSLIQAENYSAMSGVSRSATEIGGFDDGDYLRYKNVSFGSYANRIRFNVSVPAAYAGQTIEIRIDSLTGPIIGSLVVQATAGYGQHQLQIANITPTSGKRNVFLIGRGSYGVANIDYFQVYKDTGSTVTTTTTTTTTTSTSTTTTLVIPPTPSYLVTVASPVAGATVSGTIQVRGSAPGMKNVEVFSSAGAYLSRAVIDAAGNFQASVDTTKLANGIQNLRVIGWDSLPGTSYTHTNEKAVSVNVQNVSAGLPDLIIESVTTIPAQPIAGQPFRYQATIRNIGNAATPEGGIIGTVFATDSTQHVWNGTVASLAAGASMTVVTNGGFSGDTVTTSAGARHVRAHVNDANRFPESNTANNIKELYINVSASAPVGGQITFERVFNDPNMPLLKSQGGPFYPYFTYFGGSAQPDGLPGYRYWNDELGVATTSAYTPAPYNPFKIANGYLTISAIPASPNYPNSPKPYLTGILETSKGPWWETQATRDARGGFEQKYGYFEIRARVPRSKGIWPAFWLAGGIINGVTTQQGEIDIFEMIGDGIVYQTIHDWWASPHVGESHSHRPAFDHGAAFHTYGLKWTPTEIVWYIDGVETHRASQQMVARFRDNAGAMFVVMNMAVGGSWPGAPDSTTKWPANFDIEYVRVRAY